MSRLSEAVRSSCRTPPDTSCDNLMTGACPCSPRRGPVVIDSEEISEARRALGRQLAALRQAAGYNQHQFAPLTCYGRSTVANVETGRQQVPREFWERCDEVLGTDGALATGADRITAKVQQYRRDAAHAGLRRVSEDDESLPNRFTVESHKFIPAYLGAEVVQQLIGQSSLPRSRHDWLECYLVPIEATEDACELYAFACGVVVFHLQEEREFRNVASLAMWRWTSYRTALEWTGEQLRRILDSIGRPSVKPDYVLSLYCLQRSCWLEPDLDTAMRLISVPSVLINREPRAQCAEDAAAAEEALFRSSFNHPDLTPFGVQGVSLGYASWSGVSYYPLDQNRALSADELVSCELTVQALWCYCHRILTEIEHGREPTVPPEYGWRFLRAANSRLTTARAREASQHRLMRDAILCTSGLQSRLSAAQEILRESASTEGRIVR